MAAKTKTEKRPKREAAGRRLPKTEYSEKAEETRPAAAPVTLPTLNWMERTRYVLDDFPPDADIERMTAPRKAPLQVRTRIRIPTLHCESCGTVVNATDFGGEDTFPSKTIVDCIDCKRMWLAGFDACKHDFHPHEDGGELGVLCSRCGAFVLT